MVFPRVASILPTNVVQSSHVSLSFTSFLLIHVHSPLINLTLPYLTLSLVLSYSLPSSSIIINQNIIHTKQTNKQINPKLISTLTKMDGNGGCCIARWTDGGHVVSGYDKSKMDMIMLKFRPIAPKPVSPNGTPAATSDSSNNSPRDGPHAKGPTRGRRKNNHSNNNNNNSTSKKVGRKRKSNSPENRTAETETETETVGGGITLLPLFPEAPDLSPTKQQEDHNNNNNNNNNNVPIWVNFNESYNDNTNNTLGFENNYGNCQGYGW